MAHKKGVGSSRNGRDSQPKYLGVKRFGGEQVVAGNVLSEDVVHEAARAAVRGAEPLTLNAYKVELVKKLVTEALQELSG